MDIRRWLKKVQGTGSLGASLDEGSERAAVRRLLASIENSGSMGLGLS